MDDSDRQNSGQGMGDAASGDRPATPPAPQPTGSSPYGSPTQPGQGASTGSYPPPPPPPPAPQPYSPQQPQGPGQQPGYPAPGGYGAYNQPTEVYPVQGQGVLPTRYEQPTEAYPQNPYGSTPGPGGYQVPGQGYPPQDSYPQQYPPPVVVAPTKKGPPVWAWVIPLVLVIAIGAGLIAWSVLQNQENERKAAAAATATAQSQATATAAQAEINRKATGTAVAHSTATAAQALANKHATSTAQVVGTATARSEGTATAVAEAATVEAAAAAQTATALALAQLSTSETATALASLVPVNGTPTVVDTSAIVGQVQDVTVDYDTTQEGVKGMLIHVKFTVDNAKAVACQASAYFSYANGDPVKDTDGKVASVDGQVAVSEAFQPGFDNTIYNDFQIFMPYSQIEVAPGTVPLKFRVLAYVLSPYKLIASSEFVDFTMTK